MRKGLEKILLSTGRKIIIPLLAASLSMYNCSKDEKSNPITPSNPKPPTEQPIVNHPPVITSSPITSMSERESYFYEIRATDPDGDVLNYYLNKSPSWLTLSNNCVSGWPPDVQTNQNFEVELVASDNKLTTSQNYNLTVRNVSNNYLLSPSQLSGAIITDNSVSLSQPVSYAVGDIIGSGITTTTPTGLLREITSISSDKKTMQTSQATLEQVAVSSLFTYNGKLEPSSIIYSSLLDGATISRSLTKASDFNIKLKNVVLYDKDGNKNTTDDQLIANGNISFGTDILLSTNIYGGKINNFVFKNTTTMESDVTVGANVYGLATSYSVKIAECKLNPIIAGYFPPPFGLPIIFFPVLGVYVGINPTNVNPLSLRVNQKSNLEVGLTYNTTQGWAPISNFSNEFAFSNPAANGNLELKVSAGPQLELMLYNIAGPTADLKGKLRFKVSNNARDWELYGGLGASVGVKMQAFSKSLSAQLIEVINYEKLIASYKAPTPPPTPLTGGEVVFCGSRRESGNSFFDIYTINPNDAIEKNLSVNNSKYLRNITPSWNEDKTKIIFSRNFEIYSMNSDGTNLNKIIGDQSMRYASPVFSPDGTKMAYVVDNTLSSCDQIYIINSDGTNSKNLTNNFSYKHTAPSWCLNNKILFSSDRNGKSHVYSINLDGTGLTDLSLITNSTANDYEPSCSPDGTKLAFNSDRSGNNDIWIMGINGSNPVNITNTNNIYESQPSWSPDGKNIVYIDRYSIWIMNADGTGKTKIRDNINTGSDAYSPKWSR